MQIPFGYEEIIKILPHRYPFLLVDRVTDMELGKRIVGVKNITVNEPFFQGHYPGNPIMPGVLIIEAIAQTGGILARLTVEESMSKGPDIPFFFMSIDKVKFRQPIVPGDQLILEVMPLRTGAKFWKMEGKAYVKNKTVAQAELLATIG